MKKKRSERQLLELEPDIKRMTRNGARQQRGEEPPTWTVPWRLLKEYPVAVGINPDMQSREMDASVEETLLAFLDTSGVRDVEDIEEDKLTFLDATYARSGMRADASVPTQKMFQEIFHNIQESQSIELTMTSFQLLRDLEKRHPRVAVVAEKEGKTSGQTRPRLVVDNRVWSPVEHIIEDIGSADNIWPEASEEEQVPFNLMILVETISRNILDEESLHMNGDSSNTSYIHEGVNNVNILGQFFMLQHLVSLIQKDLCCRLQVFEASKDASAVKECFLYRLLCALLPDLRKAFLSNLVLLLNPNPPQVVMDEETGDVPATVDYKEANRKHGLLPSRQDFSLLAYRLLLMVVLVDYISKRWDIKNSRSLRSVSFPSDILNIFSDARDLEAFLEALDSPWMKLAFLVDYFVAYAPPDILAKGLNDSIDGETVEKLLACFGQDKTVKFVHKYSKDVLPLVLAHAFQAFLIIHAEAHGDQEKLVAVSQSLFDTLKDLRELERQTEMLPIAELAMTITNSIISLS